MDATEANEQNSVLSSPEYSNAIIAKESLHDMLSPEPGAVAKSKAGPGGIPATAVSHDATSGYSSAARE
jgi:hypothetical protein